MDHNSSEQTHVRAFEPYLYIHVDSLKAITDGRTLPFGMNDERYLRRRRYDIVSHAEMFSSLCQMD